MKNILFIFVSFIIMFSTSCVNHGTQHYKNKQIDTTILGKVTDSIFTANSGDYLYNDVIENDIKNDFENYFKNFKGKNIAAINELEFMCKNIKDYGDYCFVYMDMCVEGPFYCKYLDSEIIKFLEITFQVDRKTAKQFSWDTDNVITYKITDCKFDNFEFGPTYYNETDSFDLSRKILCVDYGTLVLKDVKFEKTN